ncbi:bifunctional diguanylate cyclase/phosphodiesterase [Reinekea marinisedimentorum]|uniref:Diguanylate cyclase (GGDEF)-like protein n=1 Tax=Reinekea marinisedimentorum TaxID=230495 RepID=A0A4R3IAT7_9GAMM|nr:EAL domain-containing protein [Reinekea marinisedimentorum]TCS43690.1 diguanylate cyclase (GGDEF)-like protein [Reinekea marinisedimentorum]
MLGFKKNIWTVFWALTLLGVMLYGAYAAKLWRAHVHHTLGRQAAQTELLQVTMESFVSYHLVILDLLAANFIATDSLPDEVETSSLFDHVVAVNPSMKAIGLISYDGDPLVISSGFDYPKHSRISEDPVRYETFKRDRQQPFSLGASHFSYQDDQPIIVIPVQRAVLPVGSSAQPQAIMTTGVNVNYMPLYQEMTADDQQGFLEVIRADGFYQYVSGDLQQYNQPVAAEYLTAISASGNSPGLKGRDDIYFKKLTRNGRDIQVAVSYSELLNSWIVAGMPRNSIMAAYLKQLALPLFILLGFLMLFGLLVRSISESENKKQLALSYQAEHDYLTQVPNRIFIRNNFSEWLEKQDRAYFISINIDDFKTVNDAFGMAFGDRILIEVSTRLKSFLLGNELLIRESGDGFIFIALRKNEKAVKGLAERIKTKLARPYLQSKNHVHMTASIGICCYPQHGKDFSDLIAAADVALRAAKNNRNSIAWLTEDMLSEHYATVQLEQRLREAIVSRSLSCVYQPQIDKRGHLYGVEALARWQDEQLGTVPPDRFIAIAERCGLMVTLGEVLLDIALKGFAEIYRRGLAELNLSVNISLKQFSDSRFVERLVAAIDRYQLPYSLITIELTENNFIDDFNRVQTICRTLTGYGIRVSLDDFGTGYSSLSVLHGIAIDELKIDKSFLTEVEEQDKSLSMLRNILSIAKDLGITVVAEGVETEQQKKLLLNLDCDILQGYYFSKPLTCEQLLPFAEKAIAEPFQMLLQS